MQLESLVIPINFELGGLLAGVEIIKDAISGVVGIAEDAIQRTEKWAEELHTLGDVTGMSGDTLAAWTFTAEKAGVSTDTLSRATVILEKGLYKADGTLDTTGKALTQFGISLNDVNGNAKDQSTLMSDISKKYAELGTQTQRVDFLTNIFGRSGAQLIDVFDTLAQSGGIDAVKAKVESLGLVLDADQYEKFQRNLNEIQLTFTGLANAFTGPLLPAAQALLATFTTWLQSPWVADQIKGIGDAVGTLLSDFNTGIQTGNFDKFWADLKKSAETGLANLGNISGQVDYIVGTWIQGLDNTIINWVNGGGPQRTADNLLGWITGVGTTPKFNSDTLIAANGMVQTFGAAIARVDWGPIDLAIGNMMQNAFNSAMDKFADWAGQQLNNLFTSWSNTIKQNALNANQFGTSNPFTGASPNNTGNNVRAKESGGSAGGLTWVGENGPELVNLPNGSNVTRASDSKAQSQIDYDQMGKAVARHLVPALQAVGIG
jgi:hypothetical protein